MKFKTDTNVSSSGKKKFTRSCGRAGIAWTCADTKQKWCDADARLVVVEYRDDSDLEQRLTKVALKASCMLGKPPRVRSED